jgi:cytochrome c1
MSRDVAAFLAWAAEPKMEERKRTGFMVMIYLAILALLLYLVKKRIWANAH